ncbi:MAG: hypothetical protein ACOC1X_03715, partial [Promethearchaeota archaeon]
MKNKNKEVCKNCKHIRKYHKFGSDRCNQPSCDCEEFEGSGLSYTTDVFNAFEQGKKIERKKREKFIKELKEKLDELGFEENNEIYQDALLDVEKI